ncbi:MAG: hypothetical protein V1921_02975 [Candidatus Altiarchaeota archaeon]
MTSAHKREYAGLFVVSLATLMYEILLTRIFSVVTWYHFAFMAVSIALFGLTVGAIIVYLFRKKFTEKLAVQRMTQASLLFSITVAGTFIVYLLMPSIFHEADRLLYTPTLLWAGQRLPADVLELAYGFLTGVLPRIVEYSIISVPFIFSGICITVALTKFPRDISRMYAFNLTGSALGCILVIQALDLFGGPTAVIVVAGVAAIGSALFSPERRTQGIRQTAVIIGISFLAVAGMNALFMESGKTLFPIVYAKGAYQATPLYEKWNSYSRIAVYGDPEKLTVPSGWGLSSTYSLKGNIRQLALNIDASALTPLTEFNGSFDRLDYLAYDVTNIAHHIRRDSDVLVIGSGGGRDILSALYFNQTSVVGVEVNGDINDVVNKVFGDFTGHLDRNPKVSFVADEARSYITRQDSRFDMIQISLIDTWAATAAGAYVLAENSLYTVEAWTVFLDHLTDGGVLSVSRWHMTGSPGEIYRLTSLATKTLLEAGVDNPRAHIFIVRGGSVGTMLMSREPFTQQDINTLEETAKRMNFEVLLSPRHSSDGNYAAISSGRNFEQFVSDFPLRIEAPTDDSPFFFNMLRLKDIFNKRLQDEQGIVSFNMKAISMLGALLFTVVFLTLLCVVVPLFVSKGRKPERNSLPFFMFFAFIGLGYMLVEISQMHRLIVFLGHPTYSLSVVLFSLLLSSGAGSYSTEWIATKNRRSALMRLSLLMSALILFGLLTPYAIGSFRASTNLVRISVALLILLPLGFFMGMAFPLGMKAASSKAAHLTPWLWGINGATSVCASVIAFVIAFAYGISTAFWTGLGCYLIAFASYVWLNRD